MKKQFLNILVFATVTFLIAATPTPMAAQVSEKITAACAMNIAPRSIMWSAKRGA